MASRLVLMSRPLRHIARASRLSPSAVKAIFFGVGSDVGQVIAVAAPMRLAAHASQRRTFFWSKGSGGDPPDSGGKGDGDKADPGAPSGGSSSSTSRGGAESEPPASEAGGSGETPAADSSANSSDSAAVPERAGRGRRSALRGTAAPMSSGEAGEAVGADAIVLVPGGSDLRKDGSTFDPCLHALPLSRRPLFPGQQQILQVTHQAVIKEIMALFDKGSPPFVAAFLHKQGEEAAASRRERGEGDGEAAKPLEDFAGTDPLEVLHQVGTRARIVQWAPMIIAGKPDGIQMLLYGYDLVTLDKVLSQGPPLHVRVSKVQSAATDGDEDTIKAFINEAMHTIREIMKINPQFREHASMINAGLERLERSDPHAIAHFAASLTTASGPELMRVLEAERPAEKLTIALELVKKELEISQLQSKIAAQIEEKVSNHQREFMLREQLKMIKKELGEDKSDGTDKLLAKFTERLEGHTVPQDAREAIDSEIEKFKNLSKESQEYQMTRNYLDWLTMMPWGKYSVDTLSLAKAKTVLDRDHYGLNEVKERIHQLIAVGVLRGSVQGKILCFVGPPGVGKTSIGRSIAEALNREFYRFSVGGLYDVAEIKGHRRTYVGAMPGKIIQCLKKVQTSNPLVLIDEVDKLGRGHQGDPASALLELLDPSQNSSFLDHYLDVPVDCSRILFVCTANVTDTIPGPLLDRMEVIRLSGYDLQEKVKIAEDYLVPTSMREVGLWPPLEEETKTTIKDEAEAATAKAEEADKAEGGAESGASKEAAIQADKAIAHTEASPPAVQRPALAEKATIDTKAIEALIRWYCREAGVRNLQKHIEKICRKLATKVVEHEEDQKKLAGDAEEVKSDSAAADEAAGPTSEKPTGDDAAADSGDAAPVKLHVTEDKLSDYAGKPVFTSDRLYEGALPEGTITGLAWTALGGSVLYIEATALPKSSGAKGGSVNLSVTGQLGSVMKESSQIALLVARREAARRLPEERQAFFEENDIFVHCPEGATPKDGPSAGVTMTTALFSLATGRPVRADLAMTGEISLNGKVLAVGGIKEKTIAARRAGCKILVYPQANQRDFDELPGYLREGLEAHFASSYDDVFSVAFPEEGQQAQEASS